MITVRRRGEDAMTVRLSYSFSFSFFDWKYVFTAQYCK